MTQSSLNCWEFMRCGREPGGIEAARRGVCPAATDASFDGLNGGRHAGRICWAVAGTCCGGKVQGSFAEKRGSCVDCEFFQQVRRERSATHACKKFLRYLCDGDHAELHRHLIYRRIRQGQRFLTQGQVADCAYIINAP